jgi:DNA-directed RNA polymerase sigma subunit (sigma70/sigma32)
MDKAKVKATPAGVTQVAEVSRPQPSADAIALMSRPMTYLEPLEEKVVRMRHGLIGGPDCRLERVGQTNDEAREMLQALEARALAHLQANPPQGDAKNRIIGRLRRE